MTSAKRIIPMLKLVADAVYPPRCPSCRAYVAGDGNFCAECFPKLRMIEDPMCACCGVPFTVAIEADAHCPQCLDEVPHFDRARAVMVYDAISAPLISALKFHDQWAGLDRYVRMMLRAGAPLLSEADLLVPVPLHWRRLFSRRYNQSALLAYGIARAAKLNCAPHVLQRVQRTKPQMRLDRAARAKNVKHAFAVPARMQAMVAGKRILLVDDVVTTGATANACARTLKQAGASEVHVLALARTVKE